MLFQVGTFTVFVECTNPLMNDEWVAARPLTVHVQVQITGLALGTRSELTRWGFSLFWKLTAGRIEGWFELCLRWMRCQGLHCCRYVFFTSLSSVLTHNFYIFSDGTKFVRLGHDVTYVAAWMEGAPVDLEWDMDDPHGADPYYKTAPRDRTAFKTHRYSEVGQYFASVTASNRLGSQRVSMRPIMHSSVFSRGFVELNI